MIGASLAMIEQIVDGGVDDGKNRRVAGIPVVLEQAVDDVTSALREVAVLPILFRWHHDLALGIYLPDSVEDVFGGGNRCVATVHPGISFEGFGGDAHPKVVLPVLAFVPGSNYSVLVLLRFMAKVVLLGCGGAHRPFQDQPNDRAEQDWADECCGRVRCMLAVRIQAARQHRFPTLKMTPLLVEERAGGRIG